MRIESIKKLSVPVKISSTPVNPHAPAEQKSVRCEQSCLRRQMPFARARYPDARKSGRNIVARHNPIAIAFARRSSLPRNPLPSRSEDGSDTVRAEMTLIFVALPSQCNREPASHVVAKCHSAQKLTTADFNLSPAASAAGTTAHPGCECEGPFESSVSSECANTRSPSPLPVRRTRCSTPRQWQLPCRRMPGKSQCRSSRWQLRTRNHGGESVENVLFSLFCYFIRQRFPTRFAHVGA